MLETLTLISPSSSVAVSSNLTPSYCASVRTPHELLTAAQHPEPSVPRSFSTLQLSSLAFFLRLCSLFYKVLKMGRRGGWVDLSSIKELRSRLASCGNTLPFSTLPQVQVLNQEGRDKPIQPAPCLALAAQLFVLGLSIMRYSDL